MNINDKRYLGDGVYAQWDGFGIILTAEDGMYAHDTIYIEPAVFSALLAMVDAIKNRTTE